MPFRSPCGLASAYSSAFSPTALSSLGTSSSHSGVFCDQARPGLLRLLFPLEQIFACLAPSRCTTTESPLWPPHLGALRPADWYCPFSFPAPSQAVGIERAGGPSLSCCLPTLHPGTVPGPVLVLS